MATVKITLDKVDWNLLMAQKMALVELSSGFSSPVSAAEREILEGVIALLDEIQDQAADQIGASVAFGTPEPDPCPETCPVTCRICGSLIDKDDGVHIEGDYYCRECYAALSSS